MTKKLLILLFFLGSFFMHAQNLVWRTNMDDAIAISNEERKPMLILFTAPGISENLQNEVFKTPDFAVWSRDNVVLVKLDISDKNIDEGIREQNLKLKAAFGVEELPEVCFARD